MPVLRVEGSLARGVDSCITGAPPGGGKMLFVWTPQRIRIVVYFVAAYLALC